MWLLLLLFYHSFISFPLLFIHKSLDSSLLWVLRLYFSLFLKNNCLLLGKGDSKTGILRQATTQRIFFFYIWRKIFCRSRVIVQKKERKKNRGMNFVFCWSSTWSISMAHRNILLNPAQVPTLCVTLVSLLLSSCVQAGDTVSPV